MPKLEWWVRPAGWKVGAPCTGQHQWFMTGDPQHLFCGLCGEMALVEWRETGDA